MNILPVDKNTYSNFKMTKKAKQTRKIKTKRKKLLLSNHRQQVLTIGIKKLTVSR